MGTSTLSWRRSSRCESTTCVEVAITRDRVLLRDSAAQVLSLPPSAWRAFCGAVARGELRPAARASRRGLPLSRPGSARAGGPSA